MKTMFRLPQLFSAVLLLSCTTSELPPQAEPVKVGTTPSTSVVTPSPVVDGVAQMYVGYAVSGKTSMIPKGDPIIPMVTQKADLSILKTSGSTGELNYIAIGGSLTAGYRDRGLTRESQLTAYPNLIAHQMGLVNFKSPLFDVTEANGSGGLIFDGTDEMPSWKQITNQTALKSNAPMTLSKYSGGDFQNISSPFIGKDGFQVNYDPKFQDYYTFPFVDRLAKSSDYLVSPYTGETNSVPSLETRLKKQTPDIYTVEFGFDGKLMNLMTQRANWAPEGGLLGSYGVSDNMKGKPVWILYPSQILQFPYFQFFTYDKLIKKLGVSEILIGTYKDQDIEKANKNCIFLPTQRIIDAINNKTSLGVVPDIEVLDALETGSAGLNTNMGYSGYNSTILNAAKSRNIPTVDLPAVYEQVLNGKYISEDGFRIDPSFPRGNFFSQDGIYPSAIGQAVIANEVIKVINKSYSSKIPLINITEFARALK
jgi:hypothetical protein